jgi:acid phosphatase type 7
MIKLSRKYNRVFLFCLAVLVVVNSGCTINPPQRVVSSGRIIGKPQNIVKSDSTTSQQYGYEPERIILNLTEKPAFSQALTWRTVSDILNPQAQITPALASPGLSKKAQTIHATTEAVKLSEKRRVYQHSIIFKSLKPETLYAYRVGDGEHWSEWNQFKTASQNRKPFKFVNFGDPQNDVKSLCSRIFRAAYKKAPDASFWHFVGDIVNHGDNDEEWGELYYAFGWIPRVTPMILLPGNHGYIKKKVNGEEIREINHLWRPQFTLPENGPDGLEESVYFLDYQGVRFVMLNGNEKQKEQAEWLDKILARNPQPWTIVSIHQPFYSTAKDRDNVHLRELFIPIFDKYSVDLVLQGHDHTYGRTYKLKNGIKVDDNEKGTVYVVSVSGPKIYSINQKSKDLMVKIGAGRQLFQVISIEQNRLKYESYTVTGQLYDSFELKKL